MSNHKQGILYVVATPIGNKEDFSFRALEILKTVDCIFAEDTRHSGMFLKSFNIDKPLLSLHAHNENQKSQSLIQKLLDGFSCALISDAGTPLISDPGYPLVSLARENKIKVVPIPGACALIAALSVAGVPTNEFTFIGFLPAQKSSRVKKLESFIGSKHSLVFYESTHRIKDCLEDITTVFGKRKPLILAKELTKTFESIIDDNVENIILWLKEDPLRVKGEFVVIIPAAENLNPEEEYTITEEKLLATLLKELPLKQAVNLATKLIPVNKNILYDKAIKLNDSED